MEQINKHIEKYENYQSLAEYNIQLIGELDYPFTFDDVRTLSTCGEWLFFKNDNGEYKLHSANFCRKRYCLICQWRKAEKQFSHCVQLADYLQEQGYRFLHLVLTVPNCERSALSATVKRLFESFGRFYSYKDIKKAFKGCLRCLEVSYNYTNKTFHPHLHCLVAVNKSYFTDSKIYLSHERLCALWSLANKTDRYLQLSVGTIKDNLGFAEVSKYCVKPLELSPLYDEDNKIILTELATTLKGTRFLQSYGVIRQALKELKLTDDEEAPSLDSEQMFVYHFNRASGKYDLTI